MVLIYNELIAEERRQISKETTIKQDKPYPGGSLCVMEHVTGAATLHQISRGMEEPPRPRRQHEQS